MAEATRCPVCGETPPTAWLCVLRGAGQAQPGEPCDYSVEGHERVAAFLDGLFESPFEIARDAKLVGDAERAARASTGGV